MGKWLKQNFITTLIVIIITALFGYIITQTDETKANYTAHAIENTQDITQLKADTKKTSDELSKHETENSQALRRIEKKVDTLVITNQKGNDQLSRLTVEIRNINEGAKAHEK